MKENKMTINNLIFALLFLLFGIILMTKWDLLSIASKIMGSILIVVGIVKAIIYIYMKGKVGNYKLSELIVGLLIIACGCLLLTYSSALSFAIRTMLGFWILFSGINRIILAISIKSFDKIGFKVYFITSILMIIMGFSLMLGLVDKIIGIFVIGYSIVEIINYIYYKTSNKDFMQKSEPVKNKKKKNVKRLKENKIIDAIIEEQKN